MSVCRTCLLNLAHTNTKYSLEQTLNEISSQTEINIQSSGLQLRKMIEKCMPEMVNYLQNKPKLLIYA